MLRDMTLNCVYFNKSVYCKYCFFRNCKKQNSNKKKSLVNKQTGTSFKKAITMFNKVYTMQLESELLARD